MKRNINNNHLNFHLNYYKLMIIPFIIDYNSRTYNFI